MLDDYRRTFPYKLIGPIIDTEQLPTGDQLDQRRSLFPRCPARNNWCSLPPPPLCFPKKWKQKIVVDRKREGGAEREKERGGKRSKKDERKTKIRADSSKRDGERGMKRERRRGHEKKRGEPIPIPKHRGDRSRSEEDSRSMDRPTTHCPSTTYCSLLPPTDYIHNS